MSYILDALKKSEAEHDPAAAANLALNQHRNQPRQRLLAMLVVAALLGNAAVLIWLFGPTAERPAAPVAAQLPPAMAKPAPDTPDQSAPARNEPVDAEPAYEPARGTTDRAAPDGTAPDGTADDGGAPMPVATEAAPIKARLSDLPPAVRARFPGLAFSTHVYADDPSLRAVVANGKRLLVGDGIDGVTVAEITEDGVILAFEDYLIEIPVVAQWQ